MAHRQAGVLRPKLLIIDDVRKDQGGLAERNGEMKKKMKQVTCLAWLLSAVMAFSMPAQAMEGSIPTDEEQGGIAEMSDIPDTVSAGDGDASGAIEMPPAEDLTGKKVNMALIVDTTGSMAGTIRNVKKSLAEFVQYIGSTGAQFRIALIDYKDSTIGENTVVHSFNHSVWSEDVDEMVNELDSLFVGGGGDWEETTVEALCYLLDEATMTFNSDAAKFAIVVTDAPYKEDNSFGYDSMEDVIDGLTERGIQVSVMTNSTCYDYYRPLTEQTGGILCSIDGNFSENLMEYAETVIQSTADAPDTEGKSVESLQVAGPDAVRPEYVYSFHVSFTPPDATDQGVYWFVEDGAVAEIVGGKGSVCYVRGLAEGSTKLTAVSRDGGYTSAMDITVSNTAPISNEYISGDFGNLREVLGIDSVTKLEYRLMDGTDVAKEEQQEIYSAINGTDKVLSFAFIDGDKNTLYRWSFAGRDITDADAKMDFNIVVNPDNPSVLDAVEDGVPEVDLHFGHEGNLPGKATVEIDVSKYFSADKLYLYYYNAAERRLELVDSDIAVVDGYAAVSLAHCSDYVLTAEMLRSLIPIDTGDDEDEGPAAEVKNEKTEKVRSPRTGEKTDRMTPVCMICFLAGAVGICRRKIRR